MSKNLNMNLTFTAQTGQAKAQIQELQGLLNKIAYASTTSIKVDPTELRAAAAAAKELQHHLNNAYNSTTGNFDLSRLDKSLKSAGTNIGALSSQLLKAGDSGQQAFASLAQSIAKADQPMLRLGTRMNEFMTTLKNTAKWQISSSMIHGFMRTIQRAHIYAQDLNESLNNIRIVTGHSVDQMAAFADQANKAAKALSTTTTEYTNASLIYYQQGLNDQQVKERTDATIKMANVSRQSAETVSDQMTAIWNNFDDGTKSLEYYGDVITALGAKTASSSEEIATGLEKFAAVSETIGLSYEYATSALATVTATTRQSADVVGTAFKTIFTRLQGLSLGETLDDGVTLNKYSEALAKVGVNALDANGNLVEMDTILDQLGNRWDTLSKAEQTALAQTVAGVRQYTQLVALMDSWDFFGENLQSAYNSEGTLTEQNEIYAESWEAAANRVKAAAEGIYQNLLDDKFFIGINDGLAKVLGGISEFVQGFGGMKSVIVAISSLLLTNFTNKIPDAIKELSINFSYLTKGAGEAYQKLQKDFSEVSKGLFAKGGRFEGQEESSFGFIVKSSNQIAAARTMAAQATENLSNSEKLAIQTALDFAEAQQQEAYAAKQKAEALKKTKKAQTDYFLDDASVGVVDSYAIISNNVSKAMQDVLPKQATSELGKDIQYAKEQMHELSMAYTKNIVGAFVKAQGQGGNISLVFTDLGESATKVLGDITELGKAINRLNDADRGEAFQSLKTELTGLVKAMPEGVREAFKLEGALQQISNASTGSQLKQGFDMLQDSLKNTSLDLTRLKHLMKGIYDPTEINMLINAFKEFTKTEDEAKQMADEVFNSLSKINFNHAVSGIEALSSGVALLGNISMGLNSIKNIATTLNDPDTSGFEKLTSSLMSISILIPSIISGVTNFSKAWKGLSLISNAYNNMIKTQTASSLAMHAINEYVAKDFREAAKVNIEKALATYLAKEADEEATKAAILKALAEAGLTDATQASAEASSILAYVKAQEANATKEATTATKNSIAGFSIATAAIIALAIAIGLWVTSGTRASKAIKEAGEACKEAETEVDNLKTEIETLSGKIKELKSQGTLTITEEAELTKLQAENDLLEQQKSIKEDLLELEYAEQQLNVLNKYDKIGTGSVSGSTSERRFTWYDETDTYHSDEYLDYNEYLNLVEKGFIEALSEEALQKWKTERGNNLLDAESGYQIILKGPELSEVEYADTLKTLEYHRKNYYGPEYEEQFLTPLINQIENIDAAVKSKTISSQIDADYLKMRGISANSLDEYFSTQIDKLISEDYGLTSNVLSQLSAKELTTLLINMDSIDPSRILALGGSLEALQGYINGLPQESDIEAPVKTISTLQNNYKTIQEIAKGLEFGDTLDPEKYKELTEAAGIDLSNYFIQMADGTYKLCSDAAEFYNLVYGKSLQDFKNSYKETKDNIDNIQKLQSDGIIESFDKGKTVDLPKHTANIVIQDSDGNIIASSSETTQGSFSEEQINNALGLLKNFGIDTEGINVGDNIATSTNLKNAINANDLISNFINLEDFTLDTKAVQNGIDILSVLGHDVSDLQFNLNEENFDILLPELISALNTYYEAEGGLTAAINNKLESDNSQLEETGDNILSTARTVAELDKLIAEGYGDESDYKKYFDNALQSEMSALGFDDYEAVINLSEQIMSKAKEGVEGYSKSLENNAEAAKEVAKEMMRYDRAVKSVSSNYDNWMKTLKKGSLSDQAAIVEEINDAYADLLDLDSGDSLSSEFALATENMELLKKATQGSKEAYNELQVAAAKDIYKKAGLENQLSNVLSSLEEIANYDAIDVGEKIIVGENNIANQLAAMYESAVTAVVEGGRSVAEAQRIANAIINSQGFEIDPVELEAKTITVTGQLPDGATPIEGDAITGPDGQIIQGWNWLNKEQGTYQYEQTIMVPKNGASITKTSEQVGGGSAPSGGGGGGGKTPERKRLSSDDRYKEINDKIDNLTETMKDYNRELDTAYGMGRVAAMDKILTKMEDEQDLLRDRIDLAKEYQAIDEKNLRNTMAGKADVEYDSFADFGVADFTIDAETGDITNWTSVWTDFYAKRDAMMDELLGENGWEKAAIGARKTELEEQITKMDEFEEKVREDAEQYMETVEQREEWEQELKDKIVEAMEMRFEKWEASLDYLEEIQEHSLEQLERTLDYFSDSFFARAEKLVAMRGISNIYNMEDAAALDEEYKTLTQLWTGDENKDGNPDITQEKYIEGLKHIEEHANNAIDELYSYMEDMTQYYKDTVDESVDILDSVIGQFDAIRSVLDHYSNIYKILEGENDYDTQLKVLEAQRDNLAAETKAWSNAYDMYSSEVKNKEGYFKTVSGEYEAILKEYREAQNSKEGVSQELQARFEAISFKYNEAKASYEAIYNAAQQAQENMLASAEEYAQAIKDIYTTELEKFGKDLEKSALSTLEGVTSFDHLNDRIEQARSLTEDWLTSTNKIYETNKLINKAQSDLDKTTNQLAKKKLKGFMDETAQLQNQAKLSKFELEVQEAKYNLLLAEIALEEAQNAKSVVRMQRDSEGNYGYVYTADSEAIGEAEQNYLDAENELYNIRLEGANEFAEKKLELDQQYYDKLREIETDESLNEQERQQKRAELMNWYQQQCAEYARIFQVAIAEDARVAQDAWSMEFSEMVTDTESWKTNTNTYITAVKNAYTSFQKEIDRLNGLIGSSMGTTGKTIKDTLNAALLDAKNKTKDLDDAIGDESNGLIEALNDEIDKVDETAEHWRTVLLPELAQAIKYYKELAWNAGNDWITEAGNEPPPIVLDKPGDGGDGDNPPPVGSPEDGTGNGDKSTYTGPGTTEKYYRVITAKGTILADGWSKEEAETLAEMANSKWWISNASVVEGEKLDRPWYDPGEEPKIIHPGKNGTVITNVGARSAKPSTMVKFNTGGYTGSWGPEGRLAMLHQKELVLNAADTENMLQAISLVRDIIQHIDLSAAVASTRGGFSLNALNDTTTALEQQVSIEANFPNVQDRYEIEAAFNNLINTASQFANRKKL